MMTFLLEKEKNRPKQNNCLIEGWSSLSIISASALISSEMNGRVGSNNKGRGFKPVDQGPVQAAIRLWDLFFLIMMLDQRAGVMPSTCRVFLLQSCFKKQTHF